MDFLFQIYMIMIILKILISVGDTLLHVAFRWGHVDIVQYLIDCGSDPTIRNEKGQTPVETLTENTKHWGTDGFDSFKYRGEPSNRNKLLSILAPSPTPPSPTPPSPSKSNEQDKQFRPTIKKALVISSSQYETHTKWTPMNAPANDGKKMVEFLQNNCGFPKSDVKYLPEANYQDFNDERIAFIDTAKRLEVDQFALFFIYYSGHGTIEDALTVGHTVKGEPIGLEEFGRQLAGRANTFVICLFDCCREILPKNDDLIRKGSSASTEPQRGQLCIIHGAEPSKSAFASRNKPLSQLTEAFLSFFQSGQAGDKFPMNLDLWEEGVKLGFERTGKSYQYVRLVPSGI